MLAYHDESRILVASLSQILQLATLTAINRSAATDRESVYTYNISIDSVVVSLFGAQDCRTLNRAINARQ
jgi:hypothetical protein